MQKKTENAPETAYAGKAAADRHFLRQEKDQPVFFCVKMRKTGHTDTVREMTAERMKQMIKIQKNAIVSRLAAVCGAGLLALGTAVQYYAQRLPDHYFAQSGRPVSVQALLPVTLQRSGPAEAEQAELLLFGWLPVKTVSLTTLPEAEVYIGGEPFGIRMLMAGVMVVSLGELQTPDGTVSPAREGGIRVGDIIQEIDGKTVTGNADLQEAVAGSGGEAVTVTLMRGDRQLSRTVTPVYVPLTGRWQTGMWVRDSTAGIGTVTYYAMTPGGQIRFAGLGHAVCDTDTGERIPLASGDVAAVDIREIVRGTAGRPGELRGIFDPHRNTGTVLANTAGGVFGTVDALPDKQLAVPIAGRHEIRRGPAVIYTTLHGTQPQAYAAEIEEIRSNDPNLRDLVVRATDPRLLEAAGGIVQGMSGSPIVQDGRLAGAVTHVFVRDPTRGYGIFAENMYAQTAAQAESERPAAAAFAETAAGE